MRNCILTIPFLLVLLCLVHAHAEDPKPALPKDKATHVDAAAADKLVTEKKVQVIDVRTPEEFADGHIAGAQNVDFSAADFAAKVSKLDKDQSYLVHCGAGGRSTRSLPIFEKLGFSHIYHLDGGLTAWKKEGGAVVK